MGLCRYFCLVGTIKILIMNLESSQYLYQKSLISKQMNEKKCQCEREWRKEKAVYEQNIELLQLQIEEFKEREENYKKFNNSLLTAYNSVQMNKTNKSKMYKEIQQSLEQQQKEMLEQKHKYQEQIDEVKIENEKLSESVQEMKLRHSSEVSELKKKIEQLNSKISQQQETIQSQEYLLQSKQAKQPSLQKPPQQPLTPINQFAENELSFDQKSQNLNNPSHCSKPTYQNDFGDHSIISNKENYPQLKNSQSILNKSNNQSLLYNDSYHKEFKLGCIVSAKSKQTVSNRSKSNMDSKNQLKSRKADEYQILSTEQDSIREQYTQKKKEQEISNSSFSNVSHITCKSSNVLDQRVRKSDAVCVSQSKSPQPAKLVLLRQEKQNINKTIEYLESINSRQANATMHQAKLTPKEEVYQIMSQFKDSRQSFSQNARERPLESFSRQLDQVRSMEHLYPLKANK